MGAIGPVMLKLVPGTIDPDMGPDGKVGLNYKDIIEKKYYTFHFNMNASSFSLEICI